jgi:hypothetical protein
MQSALADVDQYPGGGWTIEGLLSGQAQCQMRYYQNQSDWDERERRLLIGQGHAPLDGQCETWFARPATYYRP